jgi:sugar transferase (PEP-CTERM/EpsH1 system associated)
LESVCASVTLAPLDPARARLKSAASLFRGEPLTYGYYRDGAMRAAVRRLRARPLALEYAFSSSTAPYLEPEVPGRPRIADICDADSEKWREYADASQGPMRWIYRREFARLAAAETAIINGFDAALAISDAEGRILAGRPGVARRVVTIGNGVDALYFGAGDGEGTPGDGGDVALVGAMDYRPNVDAAKWFLDNVWPAVRAARPQARFSIVGARPAAELKARAGRDGVLVAGRVADVRPYLRAAKAVIAPLMIARGVQNKVLEAMAAGRPVVATSAANAGVDAAPGREILIADEPGAFAAAVIRLLERPEAGSAIGAAARARAIRDFDWESRLARLDTLVDRLLAPQKAAYSAAAPGPSAS